jgi:hypothetical protein
VSEERLERWVPLVATVLLALAAVATAWAGYQASRWHGEQAVAGARANAARVESTRVSGVANRQAQIDVATFIAWVDAYARGETGLERFYRRRFTPRLKPAVDRWIASRPMKNPNAALTPFALPEYREGLTALERSERLEDTADMLATEARTDIQRADDYVLAVVLFATSLFFAGIGTRLPRPTAQAAVVALGCVIFLGTVAWLATFPVSLSV